MPYTPSPVQTILSVPELRRFVRLANRSRTFTAGGDFHPAPKTRYSVVPPAIILHLSPFCNPSPNRGIFY